MVLPKRGSARRKSCPSSYIFSSPFISDLSLDVHPDVTALENNEESGIIHLGIPLIPVDLFVRKKKQRLVFTNALNKVIFQARAFSGSSCGCLLLDSSNRPLISILPCHAGNWRAFKGDSNDLLLFTVERTLDTFGRIELTVLPSEQNGAGSSSFKMKGSVFWRSFCIYQDDVMIAQTSLMYTLGFRKIFVSRSKFRITVFPGFSDQTLIAGLVLAFLEGRN